MSINHEDAGIVAPTFSPYLTLTPRTEAKARADIEATVDLIRRASMGDAISLFKLSLKVAHAEGAMEGARQMGDRAIAILARPAS